MLVSWGVGEVNEVLAGETLALNWVLVWVARARGRGVSLLVWYIFGFVGRFGGTQDLCCPWRAGRGYRRTVSRSKSSCLPRGYPTKKNPKVIVFIFLFYFQAVYGSSLSPGLDLVHKGRDPMESFGSWPKYCYHRHRLLPLLGFPRGGMPFIIARGGVRNFL